MLFVYKKIQNLSDDHGNILSKFDNCVAPQVTIPVLSYFLYKVLCVLYIF